jgi:hypothetical protein
MLKKEVVFLKRLLKTIGKAKRIFFPASDSIEIRNKFLEMIFRGGLLSTLFIFLRAIPFIKI